MMREDRLQPRRAKGREAGTLRGSRPVACPSASRSPGQRAQGRVPAGPAGTWPASPPHPAAGVIAALGSLPSRDSLSSRPPASIWPPLRRNPRPAEGSEEAAWPPQSPPHGLRWKRQAPRCREGAILPGPRCPAHTASCPPWGGSSPSPPGEIGEPWGPRCQEQSGPRVCPGFPVRPGQGRPCSECWSPFLSTVLLPDGGVRAQGSGARVLLSTGRGQLRPQWMALREAENGVGTMAGRRGASLTPRTFVFTVRSPQLNTLITSLKKKERGREGERGRERGRVGRGRG